MQQELRNSAGERLDYSFSEGAAASSRDPELIVIGHGVTANKDRAWAVVLAETLAAAGFSSLRFSFSGNGDSQGDFRASTPTKEAGDLGAVLDLWGERNVTYVGHSMGAAVGVMRASVDKRIKRLVSLGGMLDCADFVRRKFGELVPGTDNMWEKPDCPLSQTFMDDMAKIGSLAELSASIDIPWLLVHGTADSVIPIAESELVRERHVGSVQLLSVEHADHVFSGQAASLMAIQVRDWLIG